MLDSLESELQTVVSHHVGSWESNWGPLGEQPMILLTELCLQSPVISFLMLKSHSTYPSQKQSSSHILRSYSTQCIHLSDAKILITKSV